VKTPVIASEWVRIVEYPGHHLNDFCMFRDGRGRWHAVGIKGTGTWASEQSLFHAVGTDLSRRFENCADLLVQRPPEGTAPQKHAPFVVFDGALYRMFYRRPKGTILHLATADPDRWDGLGEVLFERRDARDVCIERIRGVYHMYYCQCEDVDGVPRSAILLRRSADLMQWDGPVVVHVDATRPAPHSYLESPYVIEGPGGYYLFIRHRLMDERRTTVVLFSDRPDRFPSGSRAWGWELDDVHAPEIVRHDGDLFIARVSGPAHSGRAAPEQGGWVETARLVFT